MRKLYLSKKIFYLFLITLSLFILSSCKGVLYTVTFDMGEGEPLLQDMKVDKNKPLKLDEPKSKTQKFLYWEYNGKKYDIKTPITKNIHLVAKWGKKDYFNVKINFTDLDYKDKKQIEIKVKNGEKLSECKDLPFKKFYKYRYRDLDEQKFINIDFVPTSDLELEAIDNLSGMPENYFKYLEKDGNSYIYDITDTPDDKNGLTSILFPLSAKYISNQLFKNSNSENTKKIKRIYLTKDQTTNLKGDVIFYNMSEDVKLFLEVDKDNVKHINFKFYSGNMPYAKDNITSKISFEYKTNIDRFVNLG